MKVELQSLDLNPAKNLWGDLKCAQEIPSQFDGSTMLLENIAESGCAMPTDSNPKTPQQNHKVLQKSVSSGVCTHSTKVIAS